MRTLIILALLCLILASCVLDKPEEKNFLSQNQSISTLPDKIIKK